MPKDRTASHFDRRALWGLREQARINDGNDAIVRLCMIGLGMATVAIAPVTWAWKIVLFLVIMFVVGIVVPVIWRARRNPN
jgi:Flp pilus assembly protein TadB